MDNIFSKDLYLQMPIRLAMVLTKSSERILIGNDNWIKQRLEGKSDFSGGVYDKVRPIGTLLIDFERDPKREWNTALSILRQAVSQKRAPLKEKLQLMIIKDPTVEDLENEAKEILKKKVESGDPVCIFAAARMWYRYQWANQAKTAQEAEDAFVREIENLIRPFTRELDKTAELDTRVLPDNPVYRWPKIKTDEDHKLILRYVGGSYQTECVYIESSFLPLKLYYTSKLETWKKYIIKCDSCGKYFMAGNRHYVYCSESCKKIGMEIAKERREGKVEWKTVDRLCRNEYQYWYTRINKAKKITGFPPKRLELLEEKMETFKAEKVEQRKRLKGTQIELNEFRDWIVQQRNIVDDLMGEYK